MSQDKFEKSVPSSYQLYLVVTDDALDAEDGDIIQEENSYSSSSAYDYSKLISKIQSACLGGVTIVQLNFQRLSTERYVVLTNTIISALSENYSEVPVLIYDRLDVCLASDANGIHFGTYDSLCCTLCYPGMKQTLLSEESIVGVSTTNVQHLEKIKQLDVNYVIAGNIGGFDGTGGMINNVEEAPLGWSFLHEFKAAAGRAIPVVAIKGLDVHNASDTIYAGADGLALDAVSTLFLQKNESENDTDIESESSPLYVENNARIIIELINVATKDKEWMKFGGSRTVNGDSLAVHVSRLRERKPLVHCITNYVSMDIMANILLASGCSPAMVHCIEEAPAFAILAGSIKGAVSINPGTVSQSWAESMKAVVSACKEKDVPWVLDPVGAGALPYRTDLMIELCRIHPPTVVRGNPSEIQVLAERLDEEILTNNGSRGQSQSGADSSLESNEVGMGIVRRLAKSLGGATICMTGATDYISDGNEHSYLVKHSVPQLQLVTATGCSLSSLIAGFIATRAVLNHEVRDNVDLEEKNSNKTFLIPEAVAHACAFYTLAAKTGIAMSCDEVRFKRLGMMHTLMNHSSPHYRNISGQNNSQIIGPATVRSALIDTLATIESDVLRAATRIERDTSNYHDDS